MKLDLVVERYVALRDKKAELKKQFEDQARVLTEAMDRLEAAILQTLNEQGVESVRTAAGTAYKSTSTSVTVADRDMFREYIVTNGAWELADIRAAKKAVEEFRAANDDIPPGLNWSQATQVGVRRS